MIVSAPEPPMAFSIVTPTAMEMFPTSPPTSLKAPACRSMRWACAKPEKSKVSFPPPSHTEA